MGESPDPPPTGLLEEWRELLLRYGDHAYGRESYTRLRAGAEATAARWVWAKAGSKLHRIEPFARELGELPEPELVAAPRKPAANREQYGYDVDERIVWVRTYGERGALWWEEFLLHEADQITSIEFDAAARRLQISRWRCRGGRVQELIEAAGSATPEGSVTVTRYHYAGERVERVSEQRFELPGGERSDQVITPSYAPDGRLLELQCHSTRHDPFWQMDSVLYRAPAEDLPDLPAQREMLARRLTEAIAGALIAARPPDRLYGLVLAYGLGGSLYVYPLFELARRYLLAGAEGGEAEAFDPLGLWSHLWLEPGDYLPAETDPAPYDRRVMEDAVAPLDDPELAQAFESYQRTAALAERDHGHGAIDGLWKDVAAQLTGLDWERLLEVTDDFVVLAYEVESVAETDIRDALEHSLPPARYTEFDANGWIPHDE